MLKKGLDTKMYYICVIRTLMFDIGFNIQYESNNLSY